MIGIPENMQKSTVDMHFLFINEFINLPFENNCFPDYLKRNKVSPIFKKNYHLDKENYRLASVLSQILKVVEGTMCNQVNTFTLDKISYLSTGVKRIIAPSIS